LREQSPPDQLLGLPIGIRHEIGRSLDPDLEVAKPREVLQSQRTGLASNGNDLGQHLGIAFGHQPISN